MFLRSSRLCFVGITFMLALNFAAHAQQNDSSADDKYIWLEDVSSARSMAWVKAENERTAHILEADPRFATYQADALKIAEDPNRLPAPDLRGGDVVYNLWRDAAHTHGLFRRTSLTSYLTAQPDWHTVLDIDALGKEEKTSWVDHGTSCLYPGDEYCMISLSAGGEDASTDRELDLKSGKFVEDGFVSKHSKQNISWLDKDTLLIARDWGADSMTESGYPYVIKMWKRGAPLDAATEIFRGRPTDISTAAYTLHDAQGHELTLIHRGVTFFESEEYIYTPDGKIAKLDIPKKSGLVGLIDGRVLIDLHENWTPEGSKASFKQGSLLQVELKDLLADPEHLRPTVVFEPTAQEFMESASTTKSRLVLTTLNHVRGRAYVYTPTAKGWSKKQIALPDNMAIGVASTDDVSDAFFLYVTGFLTPSSIWFGDATTGAVKLEKTAPAMFDASKDVVEQFDATSKDGTKVPYFVVHRKDIAYNSANATLLNAYGGFEVSMTPSYSAYIGKLWLEHGGVYVLANIRGGGEFGPAWHEAGLKTNRQRIYDDFASVGQDLVTRKITSPQHLGILGGSNGGLLMGVEMTQHPDMWNAVVIQVPLLDMLRFEKIAAGASWVGEFGSVSVPAERDFLAGISPYNQLKSNVKYPEPFIFTTTKDDRVGPQHARKFAARMEEFHEPFLYDEIVEGGHGAGADLKEEARTWAETYIYLTRKLMDSPASAANAGR